MSFQIILQKNSSDTNVMDKSIATLGTIEGTLREETSILTPIIRIEGQLPADCNYMTIPTFGRKYFINDIKAIRNNLYEVYAHVDVLTTYASAIRNSTGIVQRQENKWNLYIDDGCIRTYQKEVITIKKLPNGFSTQEFVLAVAGG